MHYFSDSDLSDFEMPGPVSPKKIDLTTSPDDDVIHVGLDNATSLYDAISRFERCIEKSGDIQQLRCQLSVLQNEKEKAEGEARTADRALEDLKECLTCIICKSVAQFPWIITPCCKVLACKECSNRWLNMDASCPHCRATVEPSGCTEVPEIRTMQDIITTMRLPSD